MKKILLQKRGISKVRLISGILVFTALMVFGVLNPLDAATCGPGPHWVDSCAAGTDVLPSILEFGVDIDTGSGLDGIPDFDAIFEGGPTIVERSDPLDDSLHFPGTRPVDGHNDVIDIEIISMNLVGTDAAAGWNLKIGTDQGLTPTLGTIAEQLGGPFEVDSFFDVTFLIVGTPLGTLHNNDFLTVEASFDRVPPPIGTDYIANLSPYDGALPLYDAGGFHVANLTDLTTGEPAHHTITPEPISSILFVTGGAVFAGRRYLRRKRNT